MILHCCYYDYKGLMEAPSRWLERYLVLVLTFSPQHKWSLHLWRINTGKWISSILFNQIISVIYIVSWIIVFQIANPILKFEIYILLVIDLRQVCGCTVYNHLGLKVNIYLSGQVVFYELPLSDVTTSLK